MEYPTNREAYEQGDWRRSYLSRILHTMPERKRLFHTLSLTVPLRSPEGISALQDLITLRSTTACAGYCPVHLAWTDLLADERMQQYLDLSAWRRHISECIPAYIRTRPDSINIPCPHSECPVLLPSEEDLWHHLGDIYSIEEAPTKKRKSSLEESQDDGVGSPRPAKKTRTKFPTDRISNSVVRPEDSAGLEFVHLSALDLEPSSPAFSRSTSSSTSGEDNLLLGATSNELWKKSSSSVDCWKKEENLCQS